MVATAIRSVIIVSTRRPVNSEQSGASVERPNASEQKRLRRRASGVGRLIRLGRESAHKVRFRHPEYFPIDHIEQLADRRGSNFRTKWHFEPLIFFQSRSSR